MVSKQFIINKDKCSGCRLCETKCSFHYWKEVNPLRSKIRIKKDDTVGLDIPMICRQCPKPACVAACPHRALSQDPQTGIILLDREKCEGTGACIKACPFDAAWLDPITRKVLICNQCNGEPECVKWCFSEALTYREKPERERNR